MNEIAQLAKSKTREHEEWLEPDDATKVLRESEKQLIGEIVFIKIDDQWLILGRTDACGEIFECYCEIDDVPTQAEDGARLGREVFSVIDGVTDG